VTTIKGAPAARMMRALSPLMSPRRRDQIDRALRDYHQIRRPSSVAEELITDGSDLSWEAADSEARVAWLAGILEGEGSFLSATFDRYRYPQIQMTMCDQYVLARAISLMPGSHIYAIVDKRGAERGWRKRGWSGRTAQLQPRSCGRSCDGWDREEHERSIVLFQRGDRFASRPSDRRASCPGVRVATRPVDCAIPIT
jgi:hypothetical protein